MAKGRNWDEFYDFVWIPAVPQAAVVSSTAIVVADETAELTKENESDPALDTSDAPLPTRAVRTPLNSMLVSRYSIRSHLMIYTCATVILNSHWPRWLLWLLRMNPAFAHLASPLYATRLFFFFHLVQR